MDTIEPTNIQPSVPPTTTRQQDITLQGQRRVNIIWEVTQAMIAVIITLAIVIVAVYDGLTMHSLDVQVPSTLSNAFFLIVGFYFSRTNHQAIGGIGQKANESEVYEGR
jgi:hypothetical protein